MNEGYASAPNQVRFPDVLKKDMMVGANGPAKPTIEGCMNMAYALMERLEEEAQMLHAALEPVLTGPRDKINTPAGSAIQGPASPLMIRIEQLNCKIQAVVDHLHTVRTLVQL